MALLLALSAAGCASVGDFYPPVEPGMPTGLYLSYDDFKRVAVQRQTLCTGREKGTPDACGGPIVQPSLIGPLKDIEKGVLWVACGRVVGTASDTLTCVQIVDKKEKPVTP
jgi:hypothetical protein